MRYEKVIRRLFLYTNRQDLFCGFFNRKHILYLDLVSISERMSLERWYEQYNGEKFLTCDRHGVVLKLVLTTNSPFQFLDIQSGKHSLILYRTVTTQRWNTLGKWEIEMQVKIDCVTSNKFLLYVMINWKLRWKFTSGCLGINKTNFYFIKTRSVLLKTLLEWTIFLCRV